MFGGEGLLRHGVLRLLQAEVVHLNGDGLTGGKRLRGGHASVFDVRQIGGERLKISADAHAADFGPVGDLREGGAVIKGDAVPFIGIDLFGVEAVGLDSLFPRSSPRRPNRGRG